MAEPTKTQYEAMPASARERAKKIWADKKRNKARAKKVSMELKEKAKKAPKIDPYRDRKVPKHYPTATSKSKKSTLASKLKSRISRADKATQ